MIFRKANLDEIEKCWDVVCAARNNMIAIGRHQWTPEYPNREIISSDIHNGNGFVLKVEDEIVAYGAVFINGEPQYEHLDGTWLSVGDYVVIHRLAVNPVHERKGYARRFFAETEAWTLNQGINSLKVDTNYDNVGMLALMAADGYKYCGEIVYQGGYRKAFEKILTPKT